MKQILFPQVNAILHGGDYNPEQWLDQPDILEEDIRLMKEAGVNTATLGVFSWSMYEPVEGEYHFEWLDPIIDRLYENGIYTILATPSGARPAWLDLKYPECMRVNAMGVSNTHGVRHNHCMSAPIYRKKVRQMNEKLAKRYGSHPGIIMWHISNELGGECHCESCKKQFKDFLRRKYHNNIEELNHQWWTTFWSHRFNDFDQIEPPSPRGEGSIHGLNLDWKRFTTWNMTDYLKAEVEVFRQYTPNIPVTTNFMCLYPGLDYNVLAKEIDVISWDSYPAWNNNYETLAMTAANTSFDHHIMRSFKRRQPFMLMESVPSQVNWHPVNKLKRPGVHNLSCMQAVACGSDTVQYFQWRKGRGSFEQYHGAVLDHLGRSDTRVFREVAQTGAWLKQLQEVQGTIVSAKAALIFDWDNRWAIQDMAGLTKDKKYEETCRAVYRLFLKHGVEVDIISSEEDLSPYSVVVAPMLYLLKEKTALHLKQFVEQGGHLLATYLTGYVNENTLCYLGGFPGDGLTEVFGLYTEEIDAIYPEERNEAIFTEDNQAYEIRDLCEVIKPLTATTHAVYGKDFYKNTPVITSNVYGNGIAWYVGARIDEKGMERLLQNVWRQAGINTKEVVDGIEFHTREDESYRYEFYLNFTEDEKEVEIKDEGICLLTNKKIRGTSKINPLSLLILKIKK